MIIALLQHYMYSTVYDDIIYSLFIFTFCRRATDDRVQQQRNRNGGSGDDGARRSKR